MSKIIHFFGLGLQPRWLHMNLFSVLRNTVKWLKNQCQSSPPASKLLQEASSVFACDGHFSLGLLSLPQSHSEIKTSSSFIQAHTQIGLYNHILSGPLLADLSGRVSSFMNQSWHNINILDVTLTIWGWSDIKRGQWFPTRQLNPQYSYMQQCYVDRYRSQTSHYQIFSSSSSRYIQYTHTHNRKSLDNSMVKQWILYYIIALEWKG